MLQNIHELHSYNTTLIESTSPSLLSPYHGERVAGTACAVRGSATQTGLDNVPQTTQNYNLPKKLLHKNSIYLYLININFTK